MARSSRLENDLRDRRARLGWTQHDLAVRSGLSRTGIGAIEACRLVPSTTAALALASALGCRVEDLFRVATRSGPGGEEWAWPSPREAGRYWRAEVGGVVRRYPVEPSAIGMVPHDGAIEGGVARPRGQADPSRTLVIATCDPAIAILAGELERSSGVRLLALGRSSGSALQLLAAGLVHAAGLHLGLGDEAGGNPSATLEATGRGGTLLRMARWDEGICASPTLRLGSVRDALAGKRRWIGREPGSGARRCLDALLEGREPPRHNAPDHRGVAQAVRSGWAEVGVCHRLAAEEAGLDFLEVRQEDHDLCFAPGSEGDPRIRAVIEAVRAASYRQAIGDLPGFGTSETGSMRTIG